jgi:hypothetical protein
VDRRTNMRMTSAAVLPLFACLLSLAGVAVPNVGAAPSIDLPPTLTAKPGRLVKVSVKTDALLIL